MPRFRLTTDEHFLLEQLTGKQYYASGLPRITERSLQESIKQGLFHNGLYPTEISTNEVLNQIRRRQRSLISDELKKYINKYPRYQDLIDTDT